MPKKRLSMRKIREILRLKHHSNCSIREISRSCGIGRGTVGDYLHRAKAAGLDWPLPDELCDTALEQQLFPSSAPRTTQPRFFPDFHEVHKELQSRKSVTLTGQTWPTIRRQMQQQNLVDLFGRNGRILQHTELTKNQRIILKKHNINTPKCILKTDISA